MTYNISNFSVNKLTELFKDGPAHGPHLYTPVPGSWDRWDRCFNWAGSAHLWRRLWSLRQRSASDQTTSPYTHTDRRRCVARRATAACRPPTSRDQAAPPCPLVAMTMTHRARCTWSWRHFRLWGWRLWASPRIEVVLQTVHTADLYVIP